MTDLDNLVAREAKFGNSHCVAGHKISVQDSEDRFMGNDKEVTLLAL